MSGRLLTILLATGLAVSLARLGRSVSDFHLPGNQQSYEPVQPIAYSHRLHAGELQIPCLYCHSAAESSRHAGIPAANVCMNCHKFVTTTLGALRAEDEAAQKESRLPRRLVSPEIQKIYDALGPDGKPIAWVRIHRLPDFVYFDHRAHVTARVDCQRCHGQVTSMERLRQAETLSMGWCVNCHRESIRSGMKASIDCGTCHY